MAAGANFLLLGPDATMLDAGVPVVVGLRGADRLGQEPDHARDRRRA